jgi:hypothetical protein
VDYRLVIDSEALQFLLNQKTSVRRQIFGWLYQLKETPFTTGRWRTRDATGREIEASIISDFCIYHWTDHPAKMIVITKIEKSL